MEAQVVHNAGETNRRAEPRTRTLRRGRIVFNGGYSSFDCTVRDISQSGAKLYFGEHLGVPNHFELIMDGHGPRRPCTVRWRAEHTIGVSFDPVQ
jgi:hypothetical protein